MKLISARASRAPRADEHAESRARDLRPALEVDDAERRPEIPVRLRRHREGARRAGTPHLSVVRGTFARRHARVRQVRNDEQAVVPPLLDQIELDALLLDLLRPLAARILDLRRVEPLALGARDLVARRVLLALEALELRQQAPAPCLERGQLLELARHVDAAVGECGSDGFEVLSEVGGIDHVGRVAVSSYNSACDRMTT